MQLTASHHISHTWEHKFPAWITLTCCLSRTVICTCVRIEQEVVNSQWVGVMCPCLSPRLTLAIAPQPDPAVCLWWTISCSVLHVTKSLLSSCLETASESCERHKRPAHPAPWIDSGNWFFSAGVDTTFFSYRHWILKSKGFCAQRIALTRLCSQHAGGRTFLQLKGSSALWRRHRRPIWRMKSTQRWKEQQPVIQALDRNVQRVISVQPPSQNFLNLSATIVRPQGRREAGSGLDWSPSSCRAIVSCFCIEKVY